MGAISLLITLLQNAAMLLAMVVIFAISSGHFALNKFAGARSNLSLQIFTGILLGTICMAIMLTPAEYVQGINFETRSVLISLTGLFFGWIPLVITFLFSTLFRYFYLDLSTATGFLVILCSGLLGVLWRHQVKDRLDSLKAAELFIFGFVVHVVFLLTMLTLPNEIQLDVIRNIMWPVLLVYPLATVLVGKLLVNFLRSKQLTQKVHDSEQRLSLAALVYQHSSEAMMVIDNERRIIDVNPMFSRITGYERDEIMGKTPTVLRSGLQSEDFYKALWKELHEKGHWSGEVWNKRKNGEVYPEWISVNAVYAADGKPYRWVAQFTDISDKKNAEEQIWRQANIDSITGLPNRSMFMDRLKQEINRTRRTGTKLALLFLDLDHFKEVNDTLGHDMGDLLLQQVALRLRRCLRETDTVARLGGDEFIIILNDVPDSQTVGTIAQKVVNAVVEPFDLHSNKVNISASVGITVCPDDSDRPEELLKNADQAMYKGKQEGRNRYCYFTGAMQEAVNKRTQLLNELRIGLQEQQLRVYFQPIVELATNRIVLVDALVHWQHPEHGLLGPGSFMPVVSDSNLIVPLGNMVIHEALQALHKIQPLNPALQINVNKYPLQFSSDDDQSRRELRHNTLTVDKLVVAVTEELLLDDRPVVQEHLQELVDAGIRIALTNFGTGYASLSCLWKFPITLLEIDQSLVSRLQPGNEAHTLCDAVVSMAHRLGIEVSAEGIETALQRDLLLESRCDLGQGSIFSPPLPLDELEQLLKSGALLDTDIVDIAAVPLQRAQTYT